MTMFDVIQPVRKHSPRDTMIINKNAGARLRIFRRILNKTQKQLAADLDISPRRLQKIENGKKSINPLIMSKLIDNYGLNTSWLFSGKQFIFTHHGKKMPVLLLFRTNALQCRNKSELLDMIDMLMLMEIPGAWQDLSFSIHKTKQLFEKEILQFKRKDRTGAYIDEAALEIVGGRHIRKRGSEETEKRRKLDGEKMRG